MQLEIWHKKLNQDEDFSLENLSLGERKKAKSFVNDIDKKNYIASHLFLRDILSHYFTHISPKEWTFEFNDYGKPSISSTHNINFHFNLSHSKSHVYVICSSTLECGIDVEDIKDIEIKDELLNIFMSKEEQGEFANSKNKNELFFKYWTLKESFVKQRAKGISMDMRDIVFKRLEEQNDYFKIDNRHYFSKKKENYYLSFTVNSDVDTVKTKFYTQEDL